MKFFSGFSLKGEEELFKFWLNSSKFTVAGFSYGAIKAFEYTLNSKKRIDRLILLSPANFMDKDEKFKRLQLISFKRDKKSYIENFIRNISEGSTIDMSRYLKEGSFEELKELLYYRWDLDKLKSIRDRGVKVEVILGEEDKIVDSKLSLELFNGSVDALYYIKRANHILIENKKMEVKN
jgi:pimeloyl-ACP methyl ester carboxylesterase